MGDKNQPVQGSSHTAGIGFCTVYLKRPALIKVDGKKTTAHLLGKPFNDIQAKDAIGPGMRKADCRQ